MTRSPAWTEAENRALVTLYFQMLDKATAGEPYSKAAMIRAVQGIEPDAAELTPHDEAYAPLANRSRPSIEFKLMNASAAHAAISAESGGNAVTMDGHGYRAMPNYQAELRDAMKAELLARELRISTDAAEAMLA